MITKDDYTVLENWLTETRQIERNLDLHACEEVAAGLASCARPAELIAALALSIDLDVPIKRTLRRFVFLYEDRKPEIVEAADAADAKTIYLHNHQVHYYVSPALITMAALDPMDCAYCAGCRRSFCEYCKAGE